MKEKLIRLLVPGPVLDLGHSTYYLHIGNGHVVPISEDKILELWLPAHSLRRIAEEVATEVYNNALHNDPQKFDLTHQAIVKNSNKLLFMAHRHFKLKLKDAIKENIRERLKNRSLLKTIQDGQQEAEDPDGGL